MYKLILKQLSHMNMSSLATLCLTFNMLAQWENGKMFSTYAHITCLVLNYFQLKTTTKNPTQTKLNQKQYLLHEIQFIRKVGLSPRWNFFFFLRSIYHLSSTALNMKLKLSAAQKGKIWLCKILRSATAVFLKGLEWYEKSHIFPISLCS